MELNKIDDIISIDNQEVLLVSIKNKLLRKFRGDEKALKELEKIAKETDSYAKIMAEMPDDEFPKYTERYKKQLEGKTYEEQQKILNDIETEAFALVREAARRTRGEFPYIEQVMGAADIQNGNVIEMLTGQGKTITATLAVYLNALTGRGVHVVTVNEYLSQRDAEAMGLIYHFLGMSVGWNSSNKSAKEKREAYACDITYTTNSELGFDYLRDNMCFEEKDKVQRELHFALIDEADSILIDEARTPLIISQPGSEDMSDYIKVDKAIKTLKEEDYHIFEKEKQVALTPSGIAYLEKYFGVKHLYSPKNQSLIHKINKSLQANIILKRGVDYMVKDDDVILIDQFTGRAMIGHAYSEGLQQAVQAKEGVTVQPENKTAATITYQNFFRLYDKLAGMTGTGKTEEEEFLSIYNMYVTQIPPHQKVIRVDQLDAIYRNKEIKFKNIVEEIKRVHSTGQPILIGTVDVATNEYLSGLLDQAGIEHETLNAKNHAREAEIIAMAGMPNAVTLATNMAGRGTDIKLTDESRKLGGLYVIGTERNEARRIDNQLRGRSGRQGDPGSSIFFVSLEDDLMQRYGGPFIQKMFEKMVSDERLVDKRVSKAITNAQKQLEGANFDSRKQLIEYDDVLRKQREIFFERREKIVKADVKEMPKQIHNYFNQAVADMVYTYKDDDAGLAEYIQDSIEPIDTSDRDYKTPKVLITEEQLKKWKKSKIKTEKITRIIEDYFMDLISQEDIMKEYCLNLASHMMLNIMDTKWVDHIDYMDKMRNAIGLRGYGQKQPVDEYKDEGYKAFCNLISSVSYEILLSLCLLRPVIQYEVE